MLRLLKKRPLDAIASMCSTCGQRDGLVLGDEEEFKELAPFGMMRVIANCLRDVDNLLVLPGGEDSAFIGDVI